MMRSKCRRGAILAMALVTLLVVTLLAGAILRGYLQGHRQLRREQDQLQAQWLAESALARAAVRLESDPKYAGETWKIELPAATGDAAPGSVTIAIEAIADQPSALRIAAAARFPEDEIRGTLVERTLTVPRPNPMTNDQ
jgi:Tfp pilus assembly protein PilX